MTDEKLTSFVFRQEDADLLIIDKLQECDAPAGGQAATLLHDAMKTEL